MTSIHHNRPQLARIYLSTLAENLFETHNLGQLQQHRVSVKGRFPDPGGPGIVLCACDERYYARFAADFVLSAEATGHRHRLHLHLYAPSERTLDHIDRLQRSLVHTELFYTWEGSGFEQYGIDPAIYYTSARYLLLHHLLAAAKAPVLCVDIDGLIRRPLDQAFHEIGSADLTIHFRLHRKPIWRRVLAAALGVNPTPLALGFCERMATSIEAVLRHKPVYHIDQTILYYMYRIRSRLKWNIRWQNLPLGWVDYEFSQDSLIWTAKGVRKQDVRFQGAIAALNEQFRPVYQALPNLGLARS